MKIRCGCPLIECGVPSENVFVHALAQEFHNSFDLQIFDAPVPENRSAIRLKGIAVQLAE